MQNLEPLQSKVELRQALLQQRRSLARAEWQEKSDRICFHLQSSPLFAAAKTILSYFSFRQEPDLSPLFTDADKNWGFPRCVEQWLHWHLWKMGEPTQAGKFGIVEPDANLPLLEAAEADLILVPAVACDLQGYRLGYGGGFYDRLLASRKLANKPTIGITFDFALLPSLPIDPWDQPLQWVCTETGFKQEK